MAAKKYYAVKKGHKPGIYETWPECQAQTNGYRGAIYKAFGAFEEAEAFINDTNLGQKHLDQARAENTVIAYVDGSFDEGARKYSFGCVILTPTGEEIKEYDCGNEDALLPTRNIAGEILGTQHAISWAVNHGYNSIIIRHDYSGLNAWFTGEWKPNSAAAIRYVDFLNSHRELVNIAFEKVKAHSGDKYNEEADRLAKLGLTLASKKKLGSGANWFSVKGVTVKEIDVILELLSEEFNTGFNATKSIENDITTFEARLGSSKLFIKYFETGTTIIQGKAHKLFHEFISHVTQLIDIEEIIPIFNGYYNLEIEKKSIEEQFNYYLPNLSSELSDQLNRSLLQSVYNLNFKGDMFDYSYLLFPALRSIEGHLKNILAKFDIPLKRDKFACFKDKNGTYCLLPEYVAIIPATTMVDYINRTYNFYSTHRHSLFHWNSMIGDFDPTRIIESKQDADILIKEALGLINEYYILKTTI